jgi:hypothetical protein
MSKATKFLSVLNFVEDVSKADLYKDLLSKDKSLKYRKDVIKAAFAKGDKFAVKQGLMKVNMEDPLNLKDYDDLLNYMSSLEKGSADLSSKSKSFTNRFLFF